MASFGGFFTSKGPVTYSFEITAKIIGCKINVRKREVHPVHNLGYTEDYWITQSYRLRIEPWWTPAPTLVQDELPIKYYYLLCSF